MNDLSDIDLHDAQACGGTWKPCPICWDEAYARSLKQDCWDEAYAANRRRDEERWS